jgi:methionyl-tRNA formyltransferase
MHQGDDALAREVLPRWLASFSELVGIVTIEERRGSRRRRLKTEWRRSRMRLLDVLAFRLVYRLTWARADRKWIGALARRLAGAYPDPPEVPALHTRDPNSEECRRFLAAREPDLMLARCKTILGRHVFDVPRAGTVVLHPGICPEYRNAHGCFWALTKRDLDHVGATLLRIDEGVDTGPVYAYYTTDFDERRESHVRIQTRVVYDNLDAIASDLQRVIDGADPLEVEDRASAAWGQPRLSDYVRWKRAARHA